VRLLAAEPAPSVTGGIPPSPIFSEEASHSMACLAS